MQTKKIVPASICFVAESTLGRLGRWMRMAGFDTVYDKHPPDARRLAALAASGQCMVLTRTRFVSERIGESKSIFLSCNAPLDQAKTVIRHLNIQRNDLKPFSRCIVCNNCLVNLSEADARLRVPDYVHQAHSHFRFCPRCRRTYWSGTHASQALKLMDRWFEPY